MKVRTSLNALAAASVLALSLMTLPPDLAHAADNSPRPTSPAEECRSRGYAWIEDKCADKPCPRAGTPGEPGDVWMQRVDGQWIYRMCDGVTGKWVVISEMRPGTSVGPAAPPPTASR